LATTEVALGVHPDDAATVRATVNFQQQRLVKAVKESWDVLMYPCFTAIALGAGWSFPRIIAALGKKILEFYVHKIYHIHVFCGRETLLIFGRMRAATLSACFFA
jgi:hypothetical protein